MKAILWILLAATVGYAQEPAYVGIGGHVDEDNGGWDARFGYRWPERIGVEAEFAADYSKWRSRGWYMDQWAIMAGPTVTLGSGAAMGLCRGLTGAVRVARYGWWPRYHAGVKTGCAAIYSFDRNARVRGGMDVLYFDHHWEPVLNIGFEVGF